MTSIRNALTNLLKRWPIALAALLLAGIIHICTTFVMPSLYRSDAYSRLARTLPLNSFVILPQAKPGAQILPFQLPDARFAICHFDVSRAPVEVQTALPEPGWTLTVYAATGEGFYSSPGLAARRLGITLMILPPGEQFLGLLNTSGRPSRRSQPLSVPTQLTSPTARGLVVVHAPTRGRSFSGTAERELKRSLCRSVGG